MTTQDTAPTQVAYPVIEAERDMAIAQRDSARRKVARLRAAVAAIVETTDMVSIIPAGFPDREFPQEIQDLRHVRAIAEQALASAAGEAVQS